MDFIAEMKLLAQEGLRRDPNYQIFGARSHHWQFGKPADMQEIRAFEKEMHISLLEPLVRYLTELGDGGAGPDYGIYSLEEMRKYNPSLRQTAKLPVMLDHSMTNAQWSDFAQKYEALDDIINTDHLAAYTKEQQERLFQEERDMELSLIAGGVFIGTPGCTMNTILMCRGAAAGEVFVVDFDYIFTLRAEPHWCGRFEDWLINETKRSLGL